MRLKSKYRQAFKDGGRVDGEIPVEPPTEQPTESAPPEAVAVEKTPEQPETKDETALALQGQIEELKRSEELQRQQTAVMQQPQPVTREQKIGAVAAVRAIGEAHFLQRNPEMIDHPQITGFAVSQAEQAGYQRGSDGHFDAVKKIFDEQFNRPQAENPAMQPTPKLFRPPPARSALKPSNFVSAPVSREVPTGSGRPRGQVKLSPSEVEAARISGITLKQYAKEKLKYEGMKATGEYRDNRDHH